MNVGINQNPAAQIFDMLIRESKLEVIFISDQQKVFRYKHS